MEKDEVKDLQIAALKDAIDEKDLIIEELKAKKQNPSVSESTQPSIPTETASIDGKEYAIVVAAFWHEGKYYLSMEAIKDLDLIAELVETQSGLVKEI